MAVRSLNHILSAFGLSLVFLLCTKADDIALRSGTSPAFNVSSSLDDYITHNDRQYAAQIASYASQLADFRDNYQRQVNTISYNKDLVEAQLVETDQKLYPLEFLDDLSKYCVQKYSKLIVSVATVRSSFQTSTTQAIGSLNTILSTPDATHRTLTSYYNSNWKNGLNDCARKNVANSQNHTICVTTLTASSNTYFNNNQRSFNNQLDSSRCSAEARIRQAVECAFPTMNRALSSVGKATGLIDDCIAGIELCEPCKEQSNNTLIVYEPDCPNVINIVSDSQTYQNATIRNPFYGMNSTMSCILVNFIQPS